MGTATKLISFNSWMRGRTAKSIFLLTALLALMPRGGFIPDSRAAFTLNWQQDYKSEGASFIDNNAYFCDGFSYMTCNGGGSSGWGGSRGGGSNDGSAFLQETLQLSGQTYFHLIVGDYTKDTMATEVFIHVSGGNSSRDNITFSDSLCNNCIQSRDFNAADALNSNSNLNGNGGGNPNSVIMHQIIQDGTIHGEFLKDSFSQKPLISQTITDSDIKSTLEMDMRGKNYSDLTPISSANFTLTQSVVGANSQGTSGDFDVHTDGQLVNLTAGAYTYTPTPLGSGSVGTGDGWGGSRDSGGSSGASGGGGGTYSYLDPFGFQPLNFNYAQFCDPSQNSGVSSSGSGGWGGYRESSSSSNCGGSGSSGGGGWSGGGSGW